jgi:hypothetical protein
MISVTPVRVWAVVPCRESLTRCDPLCVHHCSEARLDICQVDLYETIAEQPPMTAQRLVTTLAGGVVGLFAPIGFVQWLLRTGPEVAGILTLFFFPVWCLLVVLGLLIGRRAGRLVTGGRRVAQR